MATPSLTKIPQKMLNIDEISGDSPSSSSSDFGISGLSSSPDTKNDSLNKTLEKTDFYHTTVQAIQDEALAIIRKMEKSAFQTKKEDPVFFKDFLRAILGLKSEGQICLIDLHHHLEGFFDPQTLLQFVQEHKLFYDPQKKVFRRKDKEGRIPHTQVTLEIIKKTCCVEFSEKKDPIKASKRFHETFMTRGSILDRIPLSKQLLAVMDDAKLYNVIYREMMFGFYEMPIPSFFKTSFDDLKGLSSENIESLVKKIKKENLGEIYVKEEREKFLKKLQKRFNEKEGQKVFDSIMKTDFFDGFNIYLNAILAKTKEEIQKEQKSDVDIFDTKNPLTLKLIFEVMRHYPLQHFFMYAVSIAKFIKKNPNTPVEGITVDGPEDHLVSKQNFDYHVTILEYIKEKYKTKLTMHALEVPKKNFLSDLKNTKDQLGRLMTISERFGHLTCFKQTADWEINLDGLLKKGVEIPLTTVQLTTGYDENKIPFEYLFKKGVPVFPSPDDQGLIYEDGEKFTSIRKEYLKVVKTFNLGFESIVRMLRDALEYSFLEGPSIYKITTENGDSKGTVSRIHSIQEKYFESIYLGNFDQFSPREQKQCQLENHLYKYHKYFIQNQYLSFMKV